MNLHNRITLTDIARDLKQPWFRAELRTSWATAVLYRVPSLPVVWLAARLGLRPTTLTLLALLLALTMPLQGLFLPLGIAPWAVALSGILFQILDCTDGTLARVTGQHSQRGADLDFLTDMVQWALLYLAIGILADRVLGTGWGWSVVALAAVWTRLFARVVRDRLTNDIKIAKQPFQITQLPITFAEGLSGLIPFLALSQGWLGYGVVALLIYALLDLAQALLPLRAPPE